MTGGSSNEFERLMQDSVDSGDCAPDSSAFGAGAFSGAFAGAALMKSSHSPLSSSSATLGGDGRSPLVAFDATRAPPPLPRQGETASAWPLGNIGGGSGMYGLSDAAAFSHAASPLATDLASRLDEIAKWMKQSTMHEFTLAERSLLAQHRSNLDTLKAEHDNAMSQAQRNMNDLQSEHRSLRAHADHCQRQARKAMHLLAEARHRIVGRCALDRTLVAWKASTAAGKDQRLHNLLAERLRVSRVVSTGFGAWRQVSQLAMKERIIVSERAGAELGRTRLISEMALERGRLATEVEQLTRQLKEEARKRELLQDNLKRVFMRGVCALNFEAMTLLSDGTTDPSAASIGEQQQQRQQEQQQYPAAAALPSTEGPPPPTEFDWMQFERRAGLVDASAEFGDAGCGIHSLIASAGLTEQTAKTAVLEAALHQGGGASASPPRQRSSSPSQTQIPSSRRMANAEAIEAEAWFQQVSPVPAAPPVQTSTVRSTSASSSGAVTRASLAGSSSGRRAQGHSASSAQALVTVDSSQRLPFVSYVGPREHPATAAPRARQQVAKGLRWQAATSPVTVGGP